MARQKISEIIDQYLKSESENKERIEELEKELTKGEETLETQMDDWGKDGKKLRKHHYDKVMSEMKKLGPKQKELDELKAKEAARSKVENLQKLREKEIEVIKEKNEKLDKLLNGKDENGHDIETLRDQYDKMYKKQGELLDELNNQNLSEEDRKEKSDALAKLGQEMRDNQEKQDKQKSRQEAIAKETSTITALRSDLKKYAQRLNKIEASMYWLITGKAKELEDLKEKLSNWDSSDKQKENTIRAVTGTDEEKYTKTMGIDPTKVKKSDEPQAEPPAKRTKIDEAIAKLQEKHPKVAAFLQKTVNVFRGNSKKDVVPASNADNNEPEKLEPTEKLNNIVVDLTEQKENLMIALVAEYGYEQGLKKYQDQVRAQLPQERTQSTPSHSDPDRKDTIKDHSDSDDHNASKQIIEAMKSQREER